MSKKLLPIVSKFDTQEQAERYEQWFRAKVEKAMNAAKRSMPHDEVMAGARKFIKESMDV